MEYQNDNDMDTGTCFISIHANVSFSWKGFCKWSFPCGFGLRAVGVWYSGLLASRNWL